MNRHGIVFPYYVDTPGGVLWDVISNPGAGGVTWGTDPVGGTPTHYAKNKIVWGGAGTVNDVSAAAPFPTQDTPATSGGTSGADFVSVASTNAGVAKGSAGQVYGVTVTVDKAAASQVVLKLYDKATTPTVGSDAVKRRYVVQPGQQAHFLIPKGLAFASGIGYALTRGIADSDATAVGANEAAVAIDYK